MRSNPFLPFLFCAVLTLASAEDTANHDLAFKPPPDNAKPSTAFPDIQTEARRVDKLIRQSLLVPAKSLDSGFPKAEIQAFARLVSTVARQRLTEGRYEALPGQLQYFQDTLGRAEGITDDLPAFSVGPGPGTTYLYEFSGNPASAGRIAETDNPSLTVRFTYEGKEREDTQSRIALLEDLGEAILPYQRNASAFIAHDANVKLVALAGEWDDYFEKGRPQTFLDILLTTLAEKKHFKADHLVGPPPRQWFLLHPNIVIENLDAAPDGDQLGGAVAIEWFGVNFWKLKVPLGISASSLYSDRPGVDDIGHGVTVYIANRYCIGWASHGGDNGFFVSMDLLKLVDSKKRKLDDYRGQLDKIINH